MDRKKLLSVYLLLFFFGAVIIFGLLAFINFPEPEPEGDEEEIDYEWEEEVKDQVDAIARVKAASKEESFDEDFVNFGPNTTLTERIQIDKLKVDSPIFHGSDAESLLKKGFWSFPASYAPGEGEVLLLCHRRYFGEGTAKSCWDLDELKRGDKIDLQTKEGQTFTYKVEGIKVVKAGDNSIYNISSANQLRLISCAEEDGSPGSNDYRIVITAVL